MLTAPAIGLEIVEVVLFVNIRRDSPKSDTRQLAAGGKATKAIPG